MTSIELTAPAKVNLLLKVQGKRRDSYHNILTIFERISLADTVRIRKIPVGRGIEVHSDRFITKHKEDNLVYKAASLVLRDAGIKAGVRIELKKRIPIAAGLGGGSSDAAAVIKGINRLFGLKMKEKAMMRLGSRLGADVPFFLIDPPFALGRGKGDLLTEIRSSSGFWHLIIYPGFRVPTKEIYEAYDRADFALTMKSADAKITLPFRRNPGFGTAEAMLHNDLEAVVRSKRNTIGRIIERLVQILDKRAIISGSGPSIFCLYRTRKEAMAAKEKLAKSVPGREMRSWQVFVAKTF
ncbi:MAG: 4-(cytidine 5'-diphospho)-2-C-methyl-D-erythritol kinase [Candidatus Omnitrophota bacterium]